MRSDLARSATAVVALAAALITSARGNPPAPPDVATWVYGAHRWSSAETRAELGRLPAGARRVYVSVEDGPRLVLEDGADAHRLAEVLDVAHARGLAVEAMLLQDPAWAADAEGAARRATRVLAFQAARRAAGRPGFAGLHFDVEPHTEDAWLCAAPADRRAMIRGLQHVFATVGRGVRAAAPELRLSAAVPWWLGPLSASVPEAAPATWLAQLDELVLMVYGDPGGPLVGESASVALRRIDDARLWGALPRGRGLRIGLATYEYPDPAALDAALHGVARALGGRPGFMGLAVFAHGQPFDAPLVASLEGRVTDRAGVPIAGARVRGGDQETRTNRCGVFVLRRLSPPAVELAVAAEGFVPARLTASGLVPGRLRELAPLVLAPPR
jgi:carboxypeptidase family protein